jgi:PTH1 family peptidyl-tRNA hydrolase
MDPFDTGRVIVVGLGNPGPKYVDTRHNVGFDLARAFADFAQIPLKESRFDAVVGSGVFRGRQLLIMLPQTYMNRSGSSLVQAALFYKVPRQNIIVLHDDIDLDLGRVRLKQGGGHGGHNGLRSIDQHLSGKDYYRVRLGVGRPPQGWDVANWVLARFSKADIPDVEKLLFDGVDALELLLTEGLTAAQNTIHGR